MKPEEMVPPYLRELVEVLQEQESALWTWRQQYRQGREATDAARLELRKTTYPLEYEAHSKLYDMAAEVAEQLEIVEPITLYQAQQATSLNAALAPLSEAPHIMLYGDVSDELDEDELRFLLAHELSHFLLWQMENGEYQLGDDVLHTLCQETDPHNAHIHSLRRYRLYTEIFCDRCAWTVVDDVAKVITTLQKTTSGQMNQLSPAIFRQQAQGLLEADLDAMEEVSRSEMELRALAIHMWLAQADQAEPWIANMVHGNASLSTLDLLSQRRLQVKTRQVIDRFMEHAKVRTQRLLTLCRDYFPDYQFGEYEHEPNAPIESLTREHESVKQYFTYVLLDLATADPELDEVPLAVALQVSLQLEIEERFSQAAAKEMRLRKRQLQQIHEQIDTLLG